MSYPVNKISVKTGHTIINESGSFICYTRASKIEASDLRCCQINGAYLNKVTHGATPCAYVIYLLIFKIYNCSGRTWVSCANYGAITVDKIDALRELAQHVFDSQTGQRSRSVCRN